MKRSLWEPKRRIERSYARALKKIFKFVEKAIVGITDPFSMIGILKSLTQTKEFQEHAETTAMKMATHVFTDAGRTWREAAKVNGQGKSIHEALKNEMGTEVGDVFREIVKENSKLIKTIPESMTEYVSRYVAKEAQKGRRHTDIAKDLQEKFPELNKSRATLIARTESSKASTALTKARSERMGIRWYVWKTSEDSRVRSSHRHMNDVLVNWNDPPDPETLKGEKSHGNYHAGNIFNCRCYAEVVINLKTIKFPAKVYHGGQIQRMTKKEFENIM